MKARRILASVAAAAVATSALAVAASAYNGYIGYQTVTYSFRNDWNDTSYGAATDYFNGCIVWGAEATDPETYPEYEDNFDYDIGGYVLPAEYTDVTIDADGTYTVKAEGLDWGVKGDTDFNLIFVSTDIPQNEDAENPTVVCTEAKIIVDGEVVKTVENPINDSTKEYFNIGLVNIWNTEIGSYGLAYPTESLEVEFTITGIAGGDSSTGAGDVDAGTDADSKGESPDTGIEDVAVVAGLAIVAGGAIAITRKRK